MVNLMLWIGRVAGIAGAFLCVVAVLVRIGGRFWLGSFQVGTVLQAGIAAMIVGCLCFLVVLTERSGSSS
jgi:hypothetical protein